MIKKAGSGVRLPGLKSRFRQLVPGWLTHAVVGCPWLPLIIRYREHSHRGLTRGLGLRNVFLGGCLIVRTSQSVLTLTQTWQQSRLLGLCGLRSHTTGSTVGVFASALLQTHSGGAVLGCCVHGEAAWGETSLGNRNFSAPWYSRSLHTVVSFSVSVVKLVRK